MGITASVTNNQITASVGETQIDVSVSGGVGPTGSSGTVGVSAPITNAGTTTAANIGLAVGAGLAVSSGSLVVSYGTTAGTACEGNDARLSDAREWSASTATQAEAESGTSTTRRAFTPQRVFQAIAAWWAASASKTKLDGIATGATANQTDAYLLSRANHTGTQSPATVTTATTYSNFLPSGGSLDTALSGIDSALAGKVGTSDSRLTDQRVPTDGSVTDAKITSGGLSTSSLNWAAISDWQANTAYAKGDLVNVNGVAYRRSAAGTSGATFNTSNWQQITPSTTIPSDASVTTAKLANSSVTSEKIAASQTFNLLGVSTGTSGLTSYGGPIIVRSTNGPLFAVQFNVSASGQVTVGEWQGTSIAVAYGGTGATTASGARTNLGLAIGTDIPALSHAHSATSDLTFAGATAGQVLTVNSGATALVWATPTTYSLPDATTSVKGGVIVGTGLGVSSGTVSVSYGTSSGTACEGSDSRLHTRSHAITSTSDHTAGNWKVLYTNGSGQIVELDLGAANTVLQSNGASSAPSFAAVSGESFHPFLLAGM